MACKASGKGRMSEPEDIIEYLFADKILAGIRVLVTAGPTVEPIDPVRFISNRSSGKMGAAIARKALEMGADVDVVAGPVTADLSGLKVTSVQTATEMLNAVKDKLGNSDILIMAAAVADYRPADYSDIKIKKTADDMNIRLEKNPDILINIAPLKKDMQVFTGFAAESNDVRENALKKLEAKKLDFIVANDISRQDIGFETEDNEVSMFFSDGTAVDSGKLPKSGVAEIILEKAYDIFRKKNGTL